MSKAKSGIDEVKENEREETATEVCGIVMPISTIDGCAETHWTEVRSIITECIENAGFIANLVSNSDEIGVIQKRIIQNLYENPIIVCDVSGKNPNVMFELGLRLAFDRPTVIIKDSSTSYSFDTSPIEHLEYPRDLRYTAINDFKLKLFDKIKSTYAASKADANYSTFLKHFGEFKVAKITTKEVAPQELILDEIKSLRNLVFNIVKDRNVSEQTSRPDWMYSQGRNETPGEPRFWLMIQISKEDLPSLANANTKLMIQLGALRATTSKMPTGAVRIQLYFENETKFLEAKKMLMNNELEDFKINFRVIAAST